MKRQASPLFIFLCLALFKANLPCANAAAIIYEGKMASEVLSKLLETQPYRASFQFGIRDGNQSCLMHIETGLKESKIQCEFNMEFSFNSKYCENGRELFIGKIQTRDMIKSFSSPVMDSLICWRPLTPGEESNTRAEFSYFSPIF